MKPPRSILDPAFKWTPPAKQDCAATFRRIRREQREREEAQAKADMEAKAKTVTLKRKI